MMILKKIIIFIKKYWVAILVIVMLLMVLKSPQKDKNISPGYEVVKDNGPLTTQGDNESKTMYPEDIEKLLDTHGNDYVYAQKMNEFFQDYPWYKKIPIKTNDYLIIYDFDKQQFRIRLKIDPNSSEDIKNGVIQRAVQDIRNIGVEGGIIYYTVF